MIVNIKVLISSKQQTFWSVLWVVLSIVSFFLVFYGMSLLNFMTVTGEFVHTYSRLQSYCVLILLTFSYVLIDNGKQMVNVEIDYFVKKRIELLEKMKKRKMQTDLSLSDKRIVNF